MNGERRAWSLEGRLTRWFALTSAALCLTILGLSFWYVRRAVQREIAALANEELEEMRYAFAATTLRSREDFEQIVEKLRGEHPANPTAWWAWDAAAMRRWHQHGEAPLVDLQVPYRQPHGVTRSVGHSLYWTTATLDDHLDVGLLIDASAQHRILSRYAFSGLVGVGIATLLATCAGSLFARRLGRQLDRIARGVREITDTSQAPELRLSDAPVEVRQVAEALGVMVDNIRNDAEKARLITAGLAHELRAPIQNLQGEAEVGLLRERTPAEYRDILESQLDELRDLGRVVDNLVTLTARGRSTAPRPTEHFDLGEEARLRVSRETAHARRRGVDLQIETEGELAIEGDREALILAIRNLVENAVQWSDPGQRVELSIRTRGEDVVVTVDDQGPGVPVDERRRIFEPFVSTRALEGRRMGYGLGLALARSAVEGHGGTIAVVESPLGGARFLATLPTRSIDSQGEKEASAAQCTPDPDRARLGSP